MTEEVLFLNRIKVDLVSAPRILSSALLGHGIGNFNRDECPADVIECYLGTVPEADRIIFWTVFRQLFATREMVVDTVGESGAQCLINSAIHLLGACRGVDIDPYLPGLVSPGRVVSVRYGPRQRLEGYLKATEEVDRTTFVRFSNL